MKHRIRVAGILHEAGRILLVEQGNRQMSQTRWSPPGGGLELSDTDIYAGVVREVREETGLDVKPGSLRYISEFYHQRLDVLMLELWIDCFP
ncbi:MAG: NUDIX domain-containing protein [Lewinellaceae bacterium]|nr:NUDIX domain-containing protein [Lewinellaceae bacterium]